MRVEILLILIVTVLANTPYKRITDYKQYVEQWKKIVPEQYTHNVSEFANDQQQCYGKKCQFYYYESEDTSITDPLKQKTILFVSGMHGNQFLGAHTLLYAYKHLKAYKIIYFPMANPSGFIQYTRQTFPNKIDPNRDFPIDGNTKCYQTSSTHILDMLFRKYRFDLTIILHNGGTQIGFNWGTNAHVANSHTQEYNIYMDIALMMQSFGGQSQSLGLKQFNVGTMNEVIYSASGTFDDWSYAAGKFPSIITNCSSFKYQPYPTNMANGLVFLIEMGPFSTNQLGSEQGIDLQPSSNNRHNGHIARVIRILKAIMNVIDPKLEIQFINNKQMSLKVQGCKQTKISNLTVFSQNENKSWIKVFEQQNPIQLVNNQNSQSSPVELHSEVQQNILIRYLATLHCDSQWIGKGTTSFSKPRTFPVEFITKSTFLKRKPNYILMQLFDLAIDWMDYITIIIIVLLVALVLFICWRCSKRQKIEKFEEVEFVGEGQSGQHETQEQMGGDLHTARGGIINM